MSAPTPVVAVVLAGGDPEDRLAAAVGAPSKALVPLRDAPMGAYVATALRASGAVSRIVWVGKTDHQVRGLVDVVVGGGRRMVDSLALGLGAAMATAPEQRLLVVTADIPWWDAVGVLDFVAGAPADADLLYPVVREADAMARFPEQRRTFVGLADGRFTGGNAVLLSPAAVPALLPVIDTFYTARKRPLALAALVGPTTLWSLITRRATLASLEERVSRILGLRARVLVSSDAAIAADVDHPDHLPATLSLPPLVKA